MSLNYDVTAMSTWPCSWTLRTTNNVVTCVIKRIKSFYICQINLLSSKTCFLIALGALMGMVYKVKNTNVK